MNAETPENIKKWDELTEQFPIGSIVKYLGIDMIVIDIKKARERRVVPAGPTWFIDDVVCEYKDNHGIIQNKSFFAYFAAKVLFNTQL
jgi:hypothetical protein